MTSNELDFTRRLWIPAIPNNPEEFRALPPRRVPTAVLALVPVRDRVSSQEMADLLAKLLNATPDTLAGAVWSAFPDEVDPHSHMGQHFAETTEPELPPGWRLCWANVLAWTPGIRPTAWTPAPAGIVQAAVRYLDQAWPCPGEIHADAAPLKSIGLLTTNPKSRFAGAAPPPGFQPF